MVDHAEMRAAYIRALEFSPQEINQCECRIARNFETGKAFVKDQCIFCQEEELQLVQP